MNIRDAINEVLLSINELPLDSSDNIEDIPTAIIVEKEIEIAKRKVLSYGWEFNSLILSFYPNTEGNIVVPDTFLSADGTEDNPEIIVRDYKAYDKENNTFKFTGSIDLKVIDNVVFDDVPFPIANLIVKTASIKAYSDVIGTTSEIGVLKEELNDAKVLALRYDTSISETNVLTDSYSTTLLSKSSL